MTHLSAESLPWIPREFVTTFDENNHRLLDIPLDVAPSTSVSSDRGYSDHDRNKTTIFTSPPTFYSASLANVRPRSQDSW